MADAATAAPHASERDIGRFERWFLAANRGLVVAMMAVMVVLVFTNVVMRYVFGNSIIWAEEVSQFLMVWVAFIAAGLALRQGRHVAVEMLQDRLPPAVRRHLRGLVALLLAAFFVVLAVLGFQFAQFAIEQETPVLTISLAIPYLCVPLGALLLLAHLLFIRRDYVAGRLEVPESLDAEFDEDLG